MAMTLGYQTRFLIIGTKSKVVITNDQYTSGFNYADNLPTVGKGAGKWAGGSIGGAQIAMSESLYLDLGIVTDEREEFSSGGIPLSVPLTGAGSRINWNVGGKIIRVTITGIIPDGIYTSLSSTDNLNGMSNASVFRYKLNKFFAYSSIAGDDETNQSYMPNVVQYRRTYLYEMYTGSDHPTGDSYIASWTVTSYSFSFINGSRNAQYTITMDLSNNTEGILLGSILDKPISGIRPRAYGETK